MVLHEAPGALEHGKGRVPLVQMADLGLEAKRAQEAPPGDPEDELLPEAKLGAAAVELAGDAARRRRIGRIVAVEQVEREASDLHLPGPEPDLPPREIDGDADPLAAVIPGRADLQLGRIII